MTENGNSAAVHRLDNIVALLQQLVTKQQPVRLMRLKVAAAYLAMSPGQLRVLVQRGEIPKISTSENGHSPFLLDKLDLDQWIERSKS